MSETQLTKMSGNSFIKIENHKSTDTYSPTICRFIVFNSQIFDLTVPRSSDDRNESDNHQNKVRMETKLQNVKLIICQDLKMLNGCIR